MELSHEDALRLRVLLANKPRAIRIDESSMTLHALTQQDESKMSLNPTSRDDQYLRRIREELSGHVLGSPGGYPVYLKRWTRMGQARDEHLENLLLLGEPEAVIAVASARGLTDELARRAWWTSQDPDNARRMLQNSQVVQGAMGSELAHFLIEYLPFETEPMLMIESLKLALQPGLISHEERAELWKRGARKPTYYLGFLASTPDDLPQPPAAKALEPDTRVALEILAEAGNPFAQQMLRITSPQGQGFVSTCLRVMEKPANQDVVTFLLDAIREYLKELRPGGDPDMTLDELMTQAQQYQDPDYQACLQASAEQHELLVALYALSGMGYGVVRPVFSKSDAMGSLMRKKLAPVFDPLRELMKSILA
ncbi:MAG: sulfur reduction protein DsrS [Candidatus Thiodiazotropha sp.]